MTNRQWLVNGIQIYETGTEEYFIGGVQINEDQEEIVAPTVKKYKLFRAIKNTLFKLAILNPPFSAISYKP